MSNIRYTFESLTEAAEYFRHRAGNERQEAMGAPTVVAGRYHEGKAQAFSQVADILETATIEPDTAPVEV